MFGFKITYLRGSVTSSDVRTGQDKSAVEWPPHPDRLFCALVQAWGDLGEPEDGKAALLWLEKLPPPMISCGNVLPQTNPVLFVPANDKYDFYKKKVKGEVKFAPPIQGVSHLSRFRHERRLPSAPLSNNIACFWWPEINPEVEIREALNRLASMVASLGHSSSFVHLALVDSWREDELKLELVLEPHSYGNRALRLPFQGRLEELCQAYCADNAGKRKRPPLSRRWANYRLREEEGVNHRGQHAELLILRLVSESPPLPIECSGVVIDRWRQALVMCAEQPPPSIITGHASGSNEENPKPLQGPYLALLPLADVGHPYARSHLLGLAAAFPINISQKDRASALRSLKSVKELKLGRLGKWLLEPCDATEKVKALKSETWCDESKLWGSVTPFVFGKYPKDPWGEDGEMLIREACTIAGLPEPLDVRVSRVSWIPGSPPSFDFPPLPRKKGRPQRFHIHVRLAFEEPVMGPVLVGVGRHRGYGVFRQLSEETHEEIYKA